MSISMRLVAQVVEGSAVTWGSFLSASMMMAIVGLLALLVLHRLPTSSWRLRSWIVAGVLLQGIMIARAPVHLGWIESPRPMEVATQASDHGLIELNSSLPLEAAGQPPSGVTETLFASTSTQDASDRFSNIHWLSVLLAIWSTVVVSLVAIAVVRYVRVIRLVRDLDPAPQAWKRQWDGVASGPGHATDCEMLVSRTAGPMMVRRPRGYALIVPHAYWSALTSDQRCGVMLHELAHLQRGDVWRQLVARLIATIHWFNPMSWWALRQYELAAECACDQRVAESGKRVAAGFASALVQLVQWHDDSPQANRGKMVGELGFRNGLGFQSMAAPPLAFRVARLLKPNSSGESLMKRLVLTLFVGALVLVSFVQIRLTAAQEGRPDRRDGDVQVIGAEVEDRLKDIALRLDTSDPTTKSLSTLMKSPSGKLAIAGYLTELSDQSREEARDEAIPRFVDRYFDRHSSGMLVAKAESTDVIERWKSRSERLDKDIAMMVEATSDIAAKMDTSTEAGGLFKRLLDDPQAPVAVLMHEMDGGDVIARYLSEALDRLLVDQGNGVFQIVESQRREAEQQIDRFERADKLQRRLKRELPLLAAEYSAHDDRHKKLVAYLKNPMTATVAAMELSDESMPVSRAVDRLHEHFEGASVDTSTGLKIAEEEAWQQLDEIFGRVDRVGSGVMPRIRERLAEVAETLSGDDPLTRRLAAQMNREPLAALLAAELPYAEANPGQELVALLSEVMTESDGQWTINADREEEITAKSRELLRVCRQIRRYVVEVDLMLEQVSDKEFVRAIGDAGRYTLLDEIRRFAEMHRPDPVELLHEDLLAHVEGDRVRVREDRQEVVRELIQQSERVRAEEANDDF